MSQQHLPALDAVRGLAVLLVFVSHAANDGFLPPWLGQGAGQMGVQLFFMLSGYLMMRLYGPVAFDRTAIRTFWVARAARILPIYWLILILSAAAGIVGIAPYYQVDDLGTFLAAAAMVIAPQELWSIPVEVQFYALFIGIWPALASRRVSLPLAALLLCGCVVIAATWRLGVTQAPLLPSFLVPFMVGVVLAKWPVRISGTSRRSLPWLALGLLILNLPGIRGAVGAEIWQGFYPQTWLDPFRLAAATFCLVTAIATRDRWILGWPLEVLGRISLGVYLIHRPVLRGIGDLLPSTPASALALLGLSVVLAQISFRVFEQPAQRYLRRVLTPPQRRAPPPEASSPRGHGRASFQAETGQPKARSSARPTA